jgi:hypothetical protein
MAAVKATALVMTTATAGAMATAMAAVRLVSTTASAALAMRQQSYEDNDDNLTPTQKSTGQPIREPTRRRGSVRYSDFFLLTGKWGGRTLLQRRDFLGCKSRISKSTGRQSLRRFYHDQIAGIILGSEKIITNLWLILTQNIRTVCPEIHIS